MRIRVKICGITRPEDGVEAARLGADAIGLVFYGPSPRCVNLARAREIVAALPPFVTAVALFVDAPLAEIRRVIEAVPVGLLQFHGDEPPELCAGLGRPYIKVIRMRRGLDLEARARAYPDACGLLLDSYQEGVPGGTGRVFDWEGVPRSLKRPIILAGGLTPENVGAAVARTAPYGVDVSGGVESAPGIKDAGKMAAFLRGVQAADQAGGGRASH